MAAPPARARADYDYDYLIKHLLIACLKTMRSSTSSLFRFLNPKIANWRAINVRMTKTTPIVFQFSFYTFFLSFLLLFGHANCQSQFNDQEQSVLLKLKQHWQNPPSLSHWNTLNSSQYCNWPEIICFNGFVTQLLLPNKNISQTVPLFICDLRNLIVIDLSYNNIFDDFPKSLYNCSKLEDLDLSQNYFKGTIPVDIHRLSRLRHLNLGANSFSGNIPASIGQLMELRTLQLFQCAFNGSFPPEIGDLFNLERLELADDVNMIAAELPSTFTQLKKLKYLWITASNLDGEIPNKIGEMEALVHLDLSLNNLKGKIPSSLFVPKNLSIVYLFKNQLSGEIPGVVEALKIDVVDLSDNKLTGTIPNEFGRLPRLETIRLFSNNLSGILPQDFGRYSMLKEFHVADNRLRGKLPKHLCDNGRLVCVVAFNNNLTGKLPKSLGNCSGLKIVSLYNNRLSGDIPSGLWTSLDISTLMLSDNLFTGELPQSMARNLSRLEISNNLFSGNIPIEVSSWRNLVVFEASGNLFTGTIPLELTSLPRLTNLLLDQNRLTGSLPSGIISWKTLNTLNLRHNEISGPIPVELGNLSGLTKLDLSENHLSGYIPLELGLLKLTSLNLSSNNLTGKIPTQFENDAYARSFLNNPMLCANKPSLNINICNNLKSCKFTRTYLPLIIILGVGAFVVLALLFNRRRKKHGRRTTHEHRITSFQRQNVTCDFISYRSINFTAEDILSGLTEDNKIGIGGSGNVYRVVNHSGETIAVKKLSMEKAHEKQFLAEIGTLGSIQHYHIVQLIGYISCDDSKLIVYEYSRNHSLDRWLHGKDEASTASSSTHNKILNWPKRLQIAVGVAEGLNHMHHEFTPPIIHRDMKSSNILLDSEFNAKVADFGLARMMERGRELATMSSPAGTFGYMAPECFEEPQATVKIDVYSYGVILLELCTGRKAIVRHTDSESTALVKWARGQIQAVNLKDCIVGALDEEVKHANYFNEMISVFILGIMCTNEIASKRPTMTMVLKNLKKFSKGGDAEETAARLCDDYLK